MLQKDNGIKCTDESKQSFSSIKKALMKALVLVSPNFTKYFLILCFSLDHIVAGVLL